MGKLIANVFVDGQMWGPDYGNAEDVPAAVAEQITNPKAWADGAVPAEAKDSAAPGEGKGTTSPVDELAEWLTSVNADEANALADHIVADDTFDLEAKAERLQQLADTEAAGKDRKGVAEHIQDALDALTASGD